MKKDFSQPFDLSAKTTVSLFIRLDDGTYVIEKNSYDEYQLFGLEVSVDELYAQQITKYLYDYGLSLHRLRLLTKEDTVSFTFADDTPGLIEPTRVYLAHVDRVHSHSNLITASYDDMYEKITTSSSVEDNELDALELIRP